MENGKWKMENGKWKIAIIEVPENKQVAYFRYPSST
jgi:hypothetical protein